MGSAARLAENDDMLACPYDGFWAPMDTIKDKQALDAMVQNGSVPWLADTRVPLHV